MGSIVKKKIQQSIDVKNRIYNDDELILRIDEAGSRVRRALESGNKILLCGNGGSASDALHIAGELVGRFQKERQALPAIALNSDVASMTSIANDYGYDHVFERAVEGYGREGDVLIGISTSGNSNNVCMAVEKAKEMGLFTIGFTGMQGGD